MRNDKKHCTKTKAAAAKLQHSGDKDGSKSIVNYFALYFCFDERVFVILKTKTIYVFPMYLTFMVFDMISESRYIINFIM